MFYRIPFKLKFPIQILIWVENVCQILCAFYFKFWFCQTCVMQYLCLDRGKVLSSTFCSPFISDFCSFIVWHVLYFCFTRRLVTYSHPIFDSICRKSVSISVEVRLVFVLSKSIRFNLDLVIDKCCAYHFCPACYKAEHLSTV